MKLFNKKEIDDDEKKLQAFIKLAIWAVFIFLLVTFISVSPKKETPNNNDNNEVKTSYEEKLAKLNRNYKYTYLIRINNEEYVFNGTIMEDENGSIKEHGIRTIKDENKEYYLEKNHYYEVNNGLQQITKEELYKDINLDNIDVIKIKNMINNIEYKEENNSYVYEIDDYNVIVSVNESDIKEIEINENDNYYKLSFEMIGSIKKVEY